MRTSQKATIELLFSLFYLCGLLGYLNFLAISSAVMAALQSSPTEGQPLPTFAALLRGTPATSDQTVIKDSGRHKGEAALFYSDQEVADLSGSLTYALVGRGRPPMEFLCREFQTIGFKGDVNFCFDIS